MTDKILWGVLLGMKQIFDKVGCPFFLIGGTLLGFVRDGEIIPWDKDVDIGVFEEYESLFEKVIEVAKQEGWIVDDWGFGRMFGRKGRLTAFYNPKFTDGINLNYLDVFIFYKYKDIFWHGCLGEDNRYNLLAVFPKEYLNTLSTIKIKNVAFDVPNSPKEYVKYQYGENWKIPIPDEEYNKNILSMPFFDKNYAISKELKSEFLKEHKFIQPLLAIISARDIPEVKEKIDAITCIDKVWFKYMSLKENLKRVEDYFLQHTEYTHLILNSDDGAPTNEQIAMLIGDIKEYDFPVISGCCCIDKLLNDMHLNITVDAVSNVETEKDWQCLDYRLLPSTFANQNSIIKVWFQGAAACCIRRDILERVRLVYPENNGNTREWLKYGDLGFSSKCEKLGISQYVDLRCYFDHYKYDIKSGVGKVYNKGEKKPEIIFEKTTSEMPEIESVPITKMKSGFEFCIKEHTIFIGVPVCNEDQSIERCINSIWNLNYPKELIDVLFIENNSSDNSWELLQEAVKIAKTKYNYHSFKVIKDWGNYGAVEKGKDDWGMLSMDRAKHLCHVQNRIMDEAKSSDCDFCFTIMADCMVLPDTIKYYLKVFEHRYDAGWAGGVLHKRYPHHEWDKSKNPIYYGLASPTLKFCDGDSLPENWNNVWIFTLEKMQKAHDNKYPYAYGFRGMLEDEVIELRKNNHLPIIEVCCTGHAWMIRKELCNLRFKVTVVETGLQFETEMNERGYKMYCHLGVYIIHISGDGKVYHHNLSKIEQTEEKIRLVKIEQQEKKVVIKEEWRGIYNVPKQGPHP